MKHKNEKFSVIGHSPAKTNIKKTMFLIVVFTVSFLYSYIAFKLAIHFELDFNTPVRELDNVNWMLFIGLQIFLIIPFLYYLGLRLLIYLFNRFDL